MLCRMINSIKNAIRDELDKAADEHIEELMSELSLKINTKKCELIDRLINSLEVKMTEDSACGLIVQINIRK